MRSNSSCLPRQTPFTKCNPANDEHDWGDKYHPDGTSEIECNRRSDDVDTVVNTYSSKPSDRTGGDGGRQMYDDRTSDERMCCPRLWRSRRGRSLSADGYQRPDDGGRSSGGRSAAVMRVTVAAIPDVGAGLIFMWSTSPTPLRPHTGHDRRDDRHLVHDGARMSDHPGVRGLFDGDRALGHTDGRCRHGSFFDRRSKAVRVVVIPARTRLLPFRRRARADISRKHAHGRTTDSCLKAKKQRLPRTSFPTAVLPWTWGEKNDYK